MRCSAEREHYLFAPFITNTQTVSGACQGEVSFAFVDGTLDGAQLDILGDATEYTVRSTALPITNNPYTLPPSELSYAYDPSRGQSKRATRTRPEVPDDTLRVLCHG